DVRNNSGVGSLRQFWVSLGTKDGSKVTWTDGGGRERQVSYPAVRNYHDDRDPPPYYLAQVARVFRVNLEWLVDGVGPRDKLQEHIASEMAAVEREATLREREAALKDLEATL